VPAPIFLVGADQLASHEFRCAASRRHPRKLARLAFVNVRRVEHFPRGNRPIQGHVGVAARFDMFVFKLDMPYLCRT
jgi:hypothetical protein